MNDNYIAPLYQQVKEDIKSAIESGKYAPKEKIPSEPELREEYSVSRITIRRAIDELCSEGLLVKLQGRGTFVSTPRIHRKITESNNIESFTETCRSNGMVASGKMICYQAVPMRPDEQNFLQLPQKSLLLYLQRVRSADGQPIMLENLFLPYEEYKSILEQDLDSVSIFNLIECISGKRPTGTTRRTIEIVRASAEQAELLDIPISEPLFYMNIYFVDDQGRPVCIGRQYYVGSRYMFDL